jgi:uncharacterized protein YuzE
MRIKVDQASDALYIRLDESEVIESDEVQPGIVVDYNSSGKIIGIEILGIKNRVPIENLKKLQFESV